jgi:hypothetical protein
MSTNEQEEPKPETEADKRYRLKRELFDSLKEYDINPRTIYGELKSKWEKYDKDIIGKVEEALHHAYSVKNVMTYYNDGTEKGKNIVEGYLKNFLHRFEAGPSASDGFPIEYYFLGGNYEGMDYIVCFNEHCLVERDFWQFDLLFAIQFSLTHILQCGKFLTYQLGKSFNGNLPEFEEFMDGICLEYKGFLEDKHEGFYRKFIEKIRPKNVELEEVSPTGNSANKIKLNWLGSPSQFSYILSELARNGFIEIPSTNGEASYSKFAKVCWELFNFQNSTTLENLQKEMNPNKNTLSDTVRSKFQFPNLTDISKNRI